MSLLEIIGESFDPGPIGEVKIKPDPKPENNKYVRLHFILALLLLLVVEYFYLHLHQGRPLDADFWIFHGGFLIYLILAYYINIKADASNTGWVPFLIDNPFRYSDNINRLGFILEALLFPGIYIRLSNKLLSLHQKQTLKLTVDILLTSASRLP